MRFRWSAASSIVAVITIAFCARAMGATRPHYGGTLRIETHAALASLDPAQPCAPADTGARDNLLRLVAETLVKIDAHGRPVPLLASRWQSDTSGKRWQFWLRQGVTLHNGGRLTPAVVVQSLSAANAAWKFRAVGDSVVVETDVPTPHLPEELALSRYVVVIRGGDSTVGTGPFSVAEFESGRRLLLRANEDYWGGRPYIDMIDVALGQLPRDQAVHLQLGRADVVELAPDQVRRAVQENRRVLTSAPSELLAIAFPEGSGAAEDVRIREAISLSIDRGAMQNILLQRQAERSAALVPQWISGYAVLFSSTADVTRARQLRAAVPAAHNAVLLTYDGTDAMARSVAERIAVNARDAGIQMQLMPASAQVPNAPKIVRFGAIPANAYAALASIVGTLDPAGISRAMQANSMDDLYNIERSLLDDFRIVPLAHMSCSVALSSRVRDWAQSRDGYWPLEGVWLEASGQ